jgi:hypothetical protein
MTIRIGSAAGAGPDRHPRGGMGQERIRPDSGDGPAGGWKNAWPLENSSGGQQAPPGALVARGPAEG